MKKRRVEGTPPPRIRKTRKNGTGPGSSGGEALRQSEAQYHQLFDLSPDAIVIHRKNKIIQANAAALKLLGAASMDDLLGKPILDFVHPDFRDQVVDRTRRLIANAEPVSTLEEKFLRLDGTSIDVEVVAEPIHDQNGLASLTVFRDITKRKKAEDALRENEQRYRILFEGANDAIFLMDGKTFLECNEMTLRVYGCSSREDIIGHSPWEFSPAQQPDGRDSKDKAREVIQAALAGRPQRFYWVHTKKDRTPFDAEVSLSRFAIGAHTFLQAIVRDMTERRQAELLQTAVYNVTQAADTAAGLSDLFRSVHEIISTVMPAKNFYIALCNEAEDLLSFPYFVDEFDTAPEPHQARNGLTEYVLRTGKSLLCDKALDRELRLRGEVELVGAPAEIWLGVPLRLENKTIGAMVVQHYSDPAAYGRRDLLMLEYVSSQVAKSIERKAAQEALEKSETFHRRIIETAAGVPFQLYFGGSIGEGFYKYVGPGIQQLLGVSPADFTERRFQKLVEESIPLLPGIPADSAECRRKMLRGEIQHYNADLRVRTADGRVKWLNDSSLPLRDETSGKVIGAYGILLDITERKRAEEALRESETKFRAVFENSVDAIGVSKAGRHVFINPSYLTLFGYDRREELVGRPILDLIAPDQRQGVVETLSSGTQGEAAPSFFETRGLRKDGTEFDMDVHMSAFKLQDAAYTQCILRDITLQKTAKEQLEHSYEQLQKAADGIAQAMALTVELKDPYTAGHQRRVAELAHLIAREMALSPYQCECIRVAGTIHDVGKISIPTEILSKPSALSVLEYEMLKDHSRIGFEILKGIEFPWPIAPIIYQHHERMDGSGYPLGLLGESILLEAKVLAVADVVEAMASHRPYRPAKGTKIALMEISANRGVLYDPEVVDACLKVFIERGFKFDKASYLSPLGKG
jgi:PAS domain S-box-containing protein